MNRRSVSDSRFFQGGIRAFLAGLLFTQASPHASSKEDGGNLRLSSAVASAVSNLAKEKSQALVRIHGRDEEGEIHGRGFLIDPTGTVCTLLDFVRGASNLSVEWGGKFYPATLLTCDPRTGIAFLGTSIAAPACIPPFPPASPSANSPVVALATIEENERLSLPMLGMTGTRIDHDGECFFPVPLHAAMLPQAGSRPGTPVLDLSGRFAGIVLRPAMGQYSCAILPAAAVAKLHGDLLRFGKANPGWIGAVVEEAAVPEGTSRTRIATVEPGSPAERAGILPGDSLLAIGKQAIVLPQEVLEASFYLTAGQEVRLVLSRSGEVRRITLRCDPVPGAVP